MVKKKAKKVTEKGITKRDIAILWALYRYRFLPTNLIHRLLFGDVLLTVSRRRLKKLRDIGLVGRRQIIELVNPDSPISTGFVHFLTVDGGQHIGLAEPERLKNRNKVSVGAVQHFLLTNRFMIELELACEQVGFTFAEHLDELVLRGDYDRVALTEGSKTVKVAVIPDTYVAIQTPRYEKPSRLFIELDTGAEKSSIIKRKVKAYKKYLQSEAIIQRFGSQKVRILFVAKTQRRAANLKLWAEAEGAKKRFWFSSLDVLQAEALFSEALWQVASQEQKAVLITAPKQ